MQESDLLVIKPAQLLQISCQLLTLEDWNVAWGSSYLLRSKPRFLVSFEGNLLTGPQNPEGVDLRFGLGCRAC